MPDNTRVSELIKDGEKQVARYRKVQEATKIMSCDGEGCSARTILPSQLYVRVQYVIEKPGEDLRDRHQARSVDNQRRVILRFHPLCEPRGDDHGA